MPLSQHHRAGRNSYHVVWKSLFIGFVLSSIHLPCYGGDADVTLTTIDGSTKFTIQNSAAAEVMSVTSLGAVRISSNTILPGATFYQNTTVVISSPIINGFMQLMNLPKATIKAQIPKAVGQLYQCSDCTAVPVCISTGTLVNQWALITSKTTACN